MKFFNVERRAVLLKRVEEIVDLKKRDNKKLRTLSGPRIELGKVEEWDERGRGRAVKYDSGIREIWDRDDGIRCARPPWASVGPHAGTKAYLVPRLTPPFWYSTSAFPPPLLSSRSCSSCASLGSFSSFSSLLASTLRRAVRRAFLSCRGPLSRKRIR